MSKPETKPMTETDNTTQNGETTIDPDDQRWRRQTIARYLPDTVSDSQLDCLVSAVRNPDREFWEISRIAGHRDAEVRQTLHSYARGVLGEVSRKGSQNRPHRGMATSFEELTEKQKAVIDYCARHGIMSIAGNNDVSAGGIVAAIEKEGGPVMHSTTPYNTVRKYPQMLEERYGKYAAEGKLADGAPKPSDHLVGKSVRELLEMAGYENDLPPENLDEVPPGGKPTGPQTTQESDSDDAESERPTTEDDSVTTDTDETGDAESESTTTEVEDDGPEYEMLPDGATRDDVKWQTPYYARVNNVENGMAFVSLNNFNPYSQDVNGAIYHAGLPRPFGVEDLATGDEIVVALYKRRDDGKLTFNVIETIDTLHGVHFSRKDHIKALPNPEAPTQQEPEPETETGPEPEEAEEPEPVDAVEAQSEAHEEVAEEAAHYSEVLDRLEEMEARVDDLEERFEDAAEDLVDAAMSVETQAAAVAESVEAESAGVDKRMAELEASLGDQINDVEAALTRRMDDAADRDEVKAHVEGISDKIESLEAEMEMGGWETVDAALDERLVDSGTAFIVSQLERLAERGYEVSEFTRNSRLDGDEQVSITYTRTADTEENNE